MNKVQNVHLEKPAYVYIRQSTMGQVRHHRESTERQYALKNKALELGWAAGTIRILDGDLGISGAQITGREDFKALVADVSMRKVGAVFALEASRLARSCTDWHRLLELCAFTDTLIIDEDGCYNPADFNDQLLLGLKGTMSQAELHFLRARLLGGKLNKAKKGDLKTPLPVGLVYDDVGRTVLDPDDEVRHAVRMLFSSFRETGSGYGVVHAFAKKGFRFPKRAYGGAWDGRLVWGRLAESRVFGVLKNPAYAGVYVFGRYQSVKEMAADGTIRTRSATVPRSDWRVTIKDHHEAYISWDEYIHNQTILERNRTNGEETLVSGPAREGKALLQGILVCGNCGRRLTVRYKGNNGLYPTYECNWRRREGLSASSCMHIRCDLIDGPVSHRVLAVIEPKQIDIAMKALEELERRDKAVDRQWRMRIERAEYEAQLAQRRYESVDPGNRLVAASLEQRWNDTLLNVKETQNDFAEHQRKEHIIATPEQKAQLRSLARDLPRLWKSPTTQAKDRKRILRLLIKDITVKKLPEPKRIMLHLRWHGGACEDIPIKLLPNIADRLRYSKEVIDKVRGLAKTLTDAQIAAELNRQGLLSAKGKTFTGSMISWIRYRYAITALNLKRPEELTVKQVAKKFAVSTHVVYYWIARKVVNARRINQGMAYWITIDSQKEQELIEWVRNSSKIKKQNVLYSES